MTLADLVGQKIIVLIPLIEEEHFQTVTLLGVEAGGIWIESQEMVNRIYSAVKIPASEKTPVFFFPYHQIFFAMTAVEGLALNESAFGVTSRG